MPGPLFANTDRNFPTYNTNISDQFREDEFERELDTRFAEGGEELPAFLNVYLPNDHEAGPNVADLVDEAPQSEVVVGNVGHP